MGSVVEKKAERVQNMANAMSEVVAGGSMSKRRKRCLPAWDIYPKGSVTPTGK